MQSTRTRIITVSLAQPSYVYHQLSGWVYVSLFQWMIYHSQTLRQKTSRRCRGHPLRYSLSPRILSPW